MVKNIIDYYYDDYITIRIMGDNCEIYQDEETNYFWSVVNTPKIYISKGYNKYVPIDIRYSTEVKNDKLNKVCNCKLYDDFVIPIDDKNNFDPSELILVEMGDGVSMNIIRYGNTVVMSEGYSQGFF